MFRTLLMTSAIFAAAFAGGTALAQDEIITLEPETVEKPAQKHDHSDHAGHDHGEQTQVPIDIDHVYTEAPDDHAMGAEDAPVTVIMYASVTCGHCSNWFTTQWPTFKKDYVETGKVRLVFREFPTAPVGLAMTGFLIANCAADDGFFTSIEHQMETQPEVFKKAQAGEGRQAYMDIAEEAGIVGDDNLLACFTKTEHEDRLNRALARAQASNTQSVPAFYINGAAYKDDLSAASLATKIDSVINAAP